MNPVISNKLISINEILRGAWRVYSDKFLVLVGIAVVPHLLFFFAEIAIGPGSPLGDFAGVLFSAAGIAFSIASAVALVLVVSCGGYVISAYRDSTPYILSYFWLSVLGGLIVFGGFVMLFAPALIFTVWFIFGVFILVLENKKGFYALLASKEYVRGYWLPVFWRFAFLFAIFSALSYFFTLIPSSSIFNALFGTMLSPFAVAYLFMIYKNLKELKPVSGETVISKSTRNLFIFSGALGAVAILAFVFSEFL